MSSRSAHASRSIAPFGVPVVPSGLAVNYAGYMACLLVAPRFGLDVVPANLPLFIIAGSGVAMTLFRLPMDRAHPSQRPVRTVL
jgi:hypothetical protein